MVQRQGNWLGQMRVDVPHLRALESSAAADFDVLGRMLAGGAPLVLRGFEIDMNAAVGAPASDLRVVVADALVLHRGASEAGTIFWVPSDRAVEQLGGGNVRVSGSFAPDRVNYVGIDLLRAPDPATADTVSFFIPGNAFEIPKGVPLGRIMDYQFVISTLSFGARTNVLPIALVTTDGLNLVSRVEDARGLMFRLGSGGDDPDASFSYPWPEGRAELTVGDVFYGGDKAIPSLKSSLDAIMTRVWEVGGGERWYSAAADRNVALVWTGSPFSNGENFEWDGSNLHWKGLRFLFDNSTGTHNDVADQATDSPGLTNLADGDVLYVDLDRSQNLTSGSALVAAKTSLALLGSGTLPGARQVLAWRSGSQAFTKGARPAVGSSLPAATTTALGVVKLNQTPGSSSAPAVVAVMANGQISVAATGGNVPAATLVGNGTGGGADMKGGGGNAPGSTSEATGTGRSVVARGASSTVLGFLHADTAGTQVQVGSSTSHPLRFAPGGTNAWEVTTSAALNAVAAGGVVKAGNGAVGGPAFSFSAEATSGLYRQAAGDVRLAIGGADLATFSTKTSLRAATAATGGTRQDALTLTNGDLDLSGVAAPTSTTAISNRLTPANLPKAWAVVSLTNADPYVPTVDGGFNVASVARQDSGFSLRVTFAAPMANINYLVSAHYVGTIAGVLFPLTTSAGGGTVAEGRTTGYVDLAASDWAGSLVDMDSKTGPAGAGTMKLMVSILALQ